MKEQTLKFKIKFESPKYGGYSGRITFTLSESPCFQYGNGTCVTYQREFLKEGYRSQNGFIDTRYTIGIIENFEKWCKKYLQENLMPHTATLIAE